MPRWRQAPISRPARFPALRLARWALEAGGGAPTVLNAANEVAVEAFLEGDLSWLAIGEVVEETLEAWVDDHVDQVEGVLAADAEARRRAQEIVARRLSG